jgi:hypothetical protein
MAIFILVRKYKQIGFKQYFTFFLLLNLKKSNFESYPCVT